MFEMMFLSEIIMIHKAEAKLISLSNICQSRYTPIAYMHVKDCVLLPEKNLKNLLSGRDVSCLLHEGQL